MTVEQAKAILAKPRFGDPECVAAMERLRQSEQEAGMRRSVIGKKLACFACSGTADNCKCCDPEGMLTITKELADSWDYDTLQGVIDELRDGR